MTRILTEEVDSNDAPEGENNESAQPNRNEMSEAQNDNDSNMTDTNEAPEGENNDSAKPNNRNETSGAKNDNDSNMTDTTEPQQDTESTQRDRTQDIPIRDQSRHEAPSQSETQPDEPNGQPQQEQSNPGSSRSDETVNDENLSHDSGPQDAQTSTDEADNQEESTTAGANDQQSSQGPSAHNGTSANRAGIDLTVIQSDGQRHFFNIRRTTPMKKLFAAWYSTTGTTQGTVRFLYEGNRLAGNETPASLDMQDGDQIEVFMEQTGGHIGF